MLCILPQTGDTQQSRQSDPNGWSGQGQPGATLASASIGYIFSLDRDGTVRVVAEAGPTFPNGGTVEAGGTVRLDELLGLWWGELGRPGEQVLVFPGGTRTGHLGPSKVVDELYGAMRRAGIARLGPTGERRTFHSLRHTFAKRALEFGRQVTWLSRHLGHSSLKVTSDVYGHWERSERRREMALMEGVFGV